MEPVSPSRATRRVYRPAPSSCRFLSPETATCTSGQVPLFVQTSSGSIPSGKSLRYAFLREHPLQSSWKDQEVMKTIKFALICLLAAGVSMAKEHDYQKGTLLRMDSSSCGTQEKGGKTVAGEIIGTDSQNKKTKELLCQEYILQGEHV